ncbi:MAG: hypothetical protein HQK75_06705 [Candidatus Magnetomorum sp.]|nr:hypothetical protein [Candidatus Magnetomorum sp.]
MKRFFVCFFCIIFSVIVWVNDGHTQNENLQPMDTPPSQMPSANPPIFQDDFPLFPDEYESVDTSYQPPAQQDYQLSGSFETRLGLRTQSAIDEDEFSIGEARLQMIYQHKVEGLTLNCKLDFVLDPVLDKYPIKIKEGTGVMDLRELNLSIIPTDFIDIIVGRQRLSWGTGDVLFINNLFPKDWQALYIGRDESYFDAPTDAIKMGFYSLFANLDIVYVPWFDSDRIPTGERLSYYNRVIGERVGKQHIMDLNKPDDLFEDTEWAARLYNTISDFELALYTYNGYWKSPGGLEPVTWKGIYPKLNVYGLSVQGPIAQGVACFEMGLYESRNDKAGNNPYINNSQLRMLFGYRFDMPGQMQLSTQYYIEIMRDHKKYQETLALVYPEEIPDDEGRHVITVRLTRQMIDPNVYMSFLVYYCPTDTDMYVRPTLQYIFNENITFIGGANLFVGNEDHTQWGQYERNSNLYTGLQYRF